MVNNLGNKIKAARIIAGLKQVDLAKIIGYERQAISRMENGKRKIDLSEIKLIANATNKPLSFFIEEEKISESENKKKIRDLSDLEDEDIRIIDSVIERIRKTKKEDTA